MTEQRSPLKEFRHLEEKLATVGLSPAEQARYRQLKEMVSPEAARPRPGFDVNAAAEALKASLEPAGLRRTTPPMGEGAQPDLGAPPLEATALDAGAPGYDPNTAAWEPSQAQDPGAQTWDPNQPYDPNAPYGYAAPQPEAADLAGGVPPGLDAGSGAMNQGPVEAQPGAPEWDAAASYDQAAWDAAASLPPLDPAAPFDLNAPPLDATAGQGPGGSWDPGVPAGTEPAVRPYDLGPEAFDAAALPPPEPGPEGYDQAAWDAAAAAASPPEPAAGPPDAELIEAELVEADLVEAEPLPEASAPGTDLFTPGPQTPDFAGAQPLDGGTFGEGEPALSGPAAAGWPEAEAATGEGEAGPGEGGFEPTEAGGPGAAEAGEPPGAIDLGPVAEEEGAAEAVPLASPSEFLSSLEPEPRPASPADALDSGEVAIEELPPVEVDVEEIAETPEPAAPPSGSATAPPPAAGAPAPAPAALAPPDLASPAPGPAPDFGGQPASFVAGEHRVVVHTLEGQVLRGTIADVDLDAASIPLVVGSGGASEPIDASRVKAIFFMLLPGGRPPAAEGRKVRVTFRDGRQVAGFSADYHPEAVGFFMVPADSRTNTGRIWVYRAAVREVSVT